MWKRLLRRAGIQRDPTPLEVLEAHLSALNERAGSPADDSSATHLSVLNSAPAQCAVVECGLSRVEVQIQGNQMQATVFADAFLPGWTPFTEKKRALLVEYQARQLPGGHFLLEFDRHRSSFRHVAQRIEVLLRELLEHEQDAFYSVALEPERIADNGELIQCIQRLVKEQNMESRRLVYQSLVNALLYVPIEERDAELVAPEVVERTEPAPNDATKVQTLWMAFSDQEALRRCYSEAQPCVLVSGIRLVHAARNAGITALQINPRSRIGGELLHNELVTIDDYLGRLGVTPK